MDSSDRKCPCNCTRIHEVNSVEWITSSPSLLSYDSGRARYILSMSLLAVGRELFRSSSSSASLILTPWCRIKANPKSFLITSDSSSCSSWPLSLRLLPSPPSSPYATPPLQIPTPTEPLPLTIVRIGDTIVAVSFEGENKGLPPNNAHHQFGREESTHDQVRGSRLGRRRGQVGERRWEVRGCGRDYVAGNGKEEVCVDAKIGMMGDEVRGCIFVVGMLSLAVVIPLLALVLVPLLARALIPPFPPLLRSSLPLPLPFLAFLPLLSSASSRTFFLLLSNPILNLLCQPRSRCRIRTCPFGEEVFLFSGNGWVQRQGLGR